MQHRWIKWFNGYLVIMIKGKRVERLINLALHKKIEIWQISRFDEQRGRMSIQLIDFFRLKPLLKETGCRTRIISKHGFPFLLTKLRKRYAFVGGFLAFLCMLFVLSNVIWSVEVVGTEKIPKSQVLEMAKQVGIQEGKLSLFLDDPDKIKARLMEKIPDASWIGFRMNGTKAEIRVVEKIIPEEKQVLGPQHIVAKKSAVIHDIFTTHGKQMVRPNDFVKKGDLLISGLIGKEESPVAVAAKGVVEGEVWYETEAVIPRLKKQAIYTGEKHRNIYLRLWGYELKIWGFGELAISKYEIEEENHMLHWRDKQFPVGIKVEDLLECEFKQIKISTEEAVATAKEAVKQDVLAKMKTGGYIKEEKVLHQREENDKVYIKMHIIAIEDIALEKPIIIQQGD
ncbi:sporulation protein YqfD [Ammoniphilus resinae]|uniref:Sporulation protein YqfD n=1 Tax=Ammoniphilus resinae TaxID=861532 RepID=A0ABS4GJY5_9BACL|nr:sporulation protein YqfD [Ammoniphilus resinae]MBP1930529.1 hypothetical protein [Ammoniphilus resinae]